MSDVGRIKVGQAWTLVLTLPNDLDDLSSASSASIVWRAPDGSTGEWTPSELDTSAETATYNVPNDTTTVSGTWAFAAKVTFSNGDYIVGATYEHTVYGLFE